MLAFLRNYPNLETVSVDLQVVQDAAFLRASKRFSPPDALIIGTGLATQVGHLVTNDQAWVARLAELSGRIQVVMLSAHLPVP